MASAHFDPRAHALRDRWPVALVGTHALDELPSNGEFVAQLGRKREGEE